MAYHDSIADCLRRVNGTDGPDTVTPLRKLEGLRFDLSEQRKWLKRLPKLFVGSAAAIGAGFATASTVGGPLFVGGVATGVGGIASVITTVVLALIHLEDDAPSLRRKVREAQHEYDDALTARARYDAKENDVREAKDAA